MPLATTTDFFASLPIHESGLSELLGDESRFSAIPPSWHVVVTDIQDSTAAFSAGRHEVINLVATGSIIATLNLARESGIQVPFFFGGDGATLLLPPELLQSAMDALTIHRQNTRTNFDLTLRVGSVPVSDLHRDGYGIRLSRLRLTDIFSIPIVLGSGLAEAERRVKGEYEDTRPDSVGEAQLDLTGMECRWDRIRPDVDSHEVVSLLATATADAPQGPTFQRVIDLIDDIYGPPERRNPVSPNRMSLSTAKLAAETRTRFGRLNVPHLLKTWVTVVIGKLFWLEGRHGRRYVKELVDLTDTLVIDGRINTVIAGTRTQRERLAAALDSMEGEGLINYGLFVSRESVMSCYVEDRMNKHIHFVDGSDGGYTMASKVLKKKLATHPNQ